MCSRASWAPLIPIQGALLVQLRDFLLFWLRVIVSVSLLLLLKQRQLIRVPVKIGPGRVVFIACIRNQSSHLLAQPVLPEYVRLFPLRGGILLLCGFISAFMVNQLVILHALPRSWQRRDTQLACIFKLVLIRLCDKVRLEVSRESWLTEVTAQHDVLAFGEWKLVAVCDLGGVGRLEIVTVYQLTIIHGVKPSMHCLAPWVNLLLILLVARHPRHG